MNQAKFPKICLIILFACGLIYGQVSSNKNNVEPSLIKAQELIKKGNAAGALGILQTALSADSQNEKVKFWLGTAFYSTNNYQNAVEQLSPIVHKLPKTSGEYKQAVQMLGLSHYILGHLSEAIPFLEQISSWSPENNQIRYALGVSYIQTRQPAKSRETFAVLFDFPANSASAYLINAQMLVRQQFEETAETELKKALELDPKLPQAHFVLGELAIFRADIDKGIELLRQEIAINPGFAMAYYRLGEAFSRQLKWDEAIQPLQKSIWLNPFFSGPYIVLGKVYFKKNDLGNAENMLRRSVEIDPKNFGAHYLLGQVLQQSGKTEEAKSELSLAEKLRAKGEKEP
jgi:tetratricopeptide (TPR) repeat protein